MEFNFADRLRETMDMRGMTQAQLAAASNQKEPTIHRYLKGKNKSPQIDILVKMASALHVSADFLLGITDQPNGSYDLSVEEDILLSSYRKADDDHKTIIWSALSLYLTDSQRGSLLQSGAIGNKAGA